MPLTEYYKNTASNLIKKEYEGKLCLAARLVNVEKPKVGRKKATIEFGIHDGKDFVITFGKAVLEEKGLVTLISEKENLLKINFDDWIHFEYK